MDREDQSLDQSFRSSRLNERILKQKRQIEAAKVFRSEQEIQSIKLFLSILNSNRNIDNDDSDDEYTLYPYIVPFPLHILDGEIDDYTIPDEWMPRKKSSNSRCGKRLREDDDEDIFPYYRTLKNNLYRPPMVRECIKIEDIPTCLCTSSTGCDSLCQNRLLFMECPLACPSLHVGSNASRKCTAVDAVTQGHCYSNTASAGDKVLTETIVASAIDTAHDSSDDKLTPKHCANTVIQRKCFPETEVFNTKGRGFGLKVMVDVAANTILIEYLGEVISSNECIERMSSYADSDDFYFASLGAGGMFLDAGPCGSTARFANHSCDPTCELQKWTVSGEPRIVLVSKKALSAGMEITYNYQYYADGLDSISTTMKRQTCLCGSVNCSGTIGGKVVASDDDIWISKARQYLQRNRKYPLSTLYNHIDAAAGTASADSLEFRDISSIVQDAECWVYEANYVLNILDSTHSSTISSSSSSSSSVDRKTANKKCSKRNAKLEVVDMSIEIRMIQALLNRAPKCIKLDEYIKLDTLIKRAVKLDKTASVTAATAAAATTTTTTTTTTSSGDVNISRCTVTWANYVAMLKEIASIIPVHFARTYEYLQHLQQLTNWSKKWIVGVASKYAVDEGDESTHTVSAGGLQWNCVEKLLKLYGLYDAKVITNEFFVCFNFLEDRLYTYMKREGITSHNGTCDIDQLLEYAMNGNDTSTGTTTTTSTSSAESSKDTASIELHCVCRLPEYESEVGIICQCDMCHKWFHPHCVNVLPAKAKAANSTFVCPLCCHRSHRFSEFAFEPLTEWKISHKRSSIGGSVSSSSSSIPKVPKKVCKVDSDDGGAAAAAATTKSNDALHIDAVKYGGRLTASPLMSCPYVAETSNHFSLCDLDNMIDEDERLNCVTSNPIIVLMKVCRQYAYIWQKKVNAFLSSDYVMSIMAGCVGNNAVVVKVEGRCVEGSSDDFVYVTKEVEVLEKCLNLYFELRILRVCLPEVATLRQLAWLISARTVVRSCDVNARRCAPNLLFRSLPTLTNLVAMLRGGRAVGCSHTEVYTTIQHICDEAVRLLIQADSIDVCIITNVTAAAAGIADTSDDVLGLLRQFDDLSNYVDVYSEYPAARLYALHASHSKATAAVSSLSASVSNNRNSSDNNIVKDEGGGAAAAAVTVATTFDYCYCKSNNDSSMMIMCEHCLDWFHFKCVGIVSKAQSKKISCYKCIYCTESADKQEYAYKWNCTFIYNKEHVDTAHNIDIV